MPDADTASEPQRCCLGLLYYSEALKKEQKRPLCFGLTHTPNQHIDIAERSQLTEGVSEYKFFCMGHSVYEGYATRSDGDTSGSEASSSSSSSGGQPSTLPYCEGLEVVLAGQLDHLQQQQHAAHQLQQQRQQELDVSSSTGGSGSSGSGPGGGAIREVDAGALLSNLIGPADGPTARFLARFQVVADRNLRIMQSTLTTAFNLTIKPFMDKLGEGDPPAPGTPGGGSSSGGAGGGGGRAGGAGGGSS